MATGALIHLPAELGIEAAAELHRELVAHLDDAASVVLEAAAVTRIHTAVLQLFCLFCRDRRGAGHETHWQAPSEALRSAAALLGVTTLMNLTQEARA
ncbi:MAG: STAS domain-containing protein [Panacagrimonas sp.]